MTTSKKVLLDLYTAAGDEGYNCTTTTYLDRDSALFQLSCLFLRWAATATDCQEAETLLQAFHNYDKSVFTRWQANMETPESLKSPRPYNVGPWYRVVLREEGEDKDTVRNKISSFKALIGRKNLKAVFDRAKDAIEVEKLGHRIRAYFCDDVQVTENVLLSPNRPSRGYREVSEYRETARHYTSSQRLLEAVEKYLRSFVDPRFPESKYAKALTMAFSVDASPNDRDEAGRLITAHLRDSEITVQVNGWSLSAFIRHDLKSLLTDFKKGEQPMPTTETPAPTTETSAPASPPTAEKALESTPPPSPEELDKRYLRTTFWGAITRNGTFTDQVFRLNGYPHILGYVGRQQEVGLLDLKNGHFTSVTNDAFVNSGINLKELGESPSPYLIRGGSPSSRGSAGLTLEEARQVRGLFDSMGESFNNGDVAQAKRLITPTALFMDVLQGGERCNGQTFFWQTETKVTAMTAGKKVYLLEEGKAAAWLSEEQVKVMGTFSAPPAGIFHLRISRDAVDVRGVKDKIEALEIATDPSFQKALKEATSASHRGVGVVREGKFFSFLHGELPLNAPERGTLAQLQELRTALQTPSKGCVSVLSVHYARVEQRRKDLISWMGGTAGEESLIQNIIRVYLDVGLGSWSGAAPFFAKSGEIKVRYLPDDSIFQITGPEGAHFTIHGSSVLTNTPFRVSNAGTNKLSAALAALYDRSSTHLAERAEEALAEWNSADNRPDTQRVHLLREVIENMQDSPLREDFKAKYRDLKSRFSTKWSGHQGITRLAEGYVVDQTFYNHMGKTTPLSAADPNLVDLLARAETTKLEFSEESKKDFMLLLKEANPSPTLIRILADTAQHRQGHLAATYSNGLVIYLNRTRINTHILLKQGESRLMARIDHGSGRKVWIAQNNTGDIAALVDQTKSFTPTLTDKPDEVVGALILLGEYVPEGINPFPLGTCPAPARLVGYPSAPLSLNNQEVKAKALDTIWPKDGTLIQVFGPDGIATPTHVYLVSKGEVYDRSSIPPNVAWAMKEAHRGVHYTPDVKLLEALLTHDNALLPLSAVARESLARFLAAVGANRGLHHGCTYGGQLGEMTYLTSSHDDHVRVALSLKNALVVAVFKYTVDEYSLVERHWRNPDRILDLLKSYTPDDLKAQMYRSAGGMSETTRRENTARIARLVDAHERYVAITDYRTCLTDPLATPEASSPPEEKDVDEDEEDEEEDVEDNEEDNEDEDREEDKEEEEDEEDEEVTDFSTPAEAVTNNKELSEDERSELIADLQNSIGDVGVFGTDGFIIRDNAFVCSEDKIEGVENLKDVHLRALTSRWSEAAFSRDEDLIVFFMRTNLSAQTKEVGLRLLTAGAGATTGLYDRTFSVLKKGVRFVFVHHESLFSFAVFNKTEAIHFEIRKDSSREYQLVGDEVARTPSLSGLLSNVRTISPAELANEMEEACELPLQELQAGLGEIANNIVNKPVTNYHKVYERAVDAKRGDAKAPQDQTNTADPKAATPPPDQQSLVNQVMSNGDCQLVDRGLILGDVFYPDVGISVALRRLSDSVLEEMTRSSAKGAVSPQHQGMLRAAWGATGGHTLQVTVRALFAAASSVYGLQNRSVLLQLPNNTLLALYGEGQSSYLVMLQASGRAYLKVSITPRGEVDPDGLPLFSAQSRSQRSDALLAALKAVGDLTVLTASFNTDRAAEKSQQRVKLFCEKMMEATAPGLAPSEEQLVQLYQQVANNTAVDSTQETASPPTKESDMSAVTTAATPQDAATNNKEELLAQLKSTPTRLHSKGIIIEGRNYPFSGISYKLDDTSDIPELEKMVETGRTGLTLPFDRSVLRQAWKTGEHARLQVILTVLFAAASSANSLTNRSAILVVGGLCVALRSNSEGLTLLVSTSSKKAYLALHLTYTTKSDAGLVEDVDWTCSSSDSPDLLQALRAAGGLDSLKHFFGITYEERRSRDVELDVQSRIEAFQKGLIRIADVTTLEALEKALLGGANTPENPVQEGEGSTPSTKETTMAKTTEDLKEPAAPVTALERAKTALKADAHDAAWRTAGSQLVKLTREPLVALLSRHLGPDDESLRKKVADFLSTEVGTALLAAVLATALGTIPSTGEVPQRLARELRVKAMSDMGDLTADVLMGPLRQVISMYLQGVPEIGGETMPALPPASPSATEVLDGHHGDLSKINGEKRPTAKA